MDKDYYSVLGVQPDAPEATVKAAYRRLARAHHPDLAPERDTGALRAAGIKMREINEAYAVLRHEQRQRNAPSPADRGQETPPEDRFDPSEEYGSGGGDPGFAGAPHRDGHAAGGTARPAPAGTVSAAVMEGLVSGFLEKLGGRLQQDHAAPRLSPAHVDGFKLALRGKLDGAKCTVAAQTYVHLDAAKAAEFVRAGMTVVERDRSSLRPNVFILLVVYGSADALEAVVRSVRRLPTVVKRNHERDECVVALVPALGGQPVVFGNAVKTVAPLRTLVARLLPGASVH